MAAIKFGEGFKTADAHRPAYVTMLKQQAVELAKIQGHAWPRGAEPFSCNPVGFVQRESRTKNAGAHASDLAAFPPAPRPPQAGRRLALVAAQRHRLPDPRDDRHLLLRLRHWCEHS